MKLYQEKSEANFKNKLIYLLIVMMGVLVIVFIFFYKQLVDQYSRHAYMVTSEGTLVGKIEKDYRVGAVELRTHLRSFYNTMFSFTADTYENNTKYAKNYLCDYETGKYIDKVLTEADLYNEMLRKNAHMLTLLDSIGKVDFSHGEPYQVTAYCTQYMVIGNEKASIPFINTMDVVAEGIVRTDENPTGLQIRNWRNVKVEQ